MGKINLRTIIDITSVYSGVAVYAIVDSVTKNKVVSIGSGIGTFAVIKGTSDTIYESKERKQQNIAEDITNDNTDNTEVDSELLDDILDGEDIELITEESEKDHINESNDTEEQIEETPDETICEAESAVTEDGNGQSVSEEVTKDSTETEVFPETTLEEARKEVAEGAEKYLEDLDSVILKKYRSGKSEKSATSKPKTKTTKSNKGKK